MNALRIDRSRNRLYDGIVTRFSEALIHNWFTKEQKINVMQYAFDEDAIAADVVIGDGSAVLGMGADKILGKVLKKVPITAAVKWLIDQRNKICGTSNSVNSGNPIRKGLDINLQFFAMDTQADEAVEAVAKNSDVTDAGTAGGHVATQGGKTSINSSELVFGSSTKSTQKLMNQINNRGWTEDLVRNTVDNPYTIRTSVNKRTGNSATVFYTQQGSYVIVDDVTKEIVQISDNINPSTWVPDTSIVDPYIPD